MIHVESQPIGKQGSVSSYNWPTVDAVVQLRLCAALEQLDQARRYAGDVGSELWQFAVPVNELQRCDLSPTDLRWLVAKGYADFGIETEPLGAVRQFIYPVAVAIHAGTCLVITASGQRLLERLGDDAAYLSASGSSHGCTAQCSTAQCSSAHCPRWDRLRYELHFGDALVKRFRLPAPNQKRILAAFEEEHWPARIDDPLPPHPEIDSKRRLHHTLIALNRNQQQRLIRFHGDGTGQGVRWTVRDGLVEA